MSVLKWSLLSGAVVLAAVLFFSSYYVVSVHESAIVTQFGRVVAVRTEPGLYLKTPFVQAVTYYDMRLREWDGEPRDLLTVDKENIEINTWARWRITDPEKFYVAVTTESRGMGVLDGAIEATVKNVVSAQPLMEMLRNTERRLKYTAQELEEAEASKNIKVELGRERIVKEQILTGVQEKTGVEYGLEVVGLSVKHMNYVRAVIPKIHDRMKSERIRIANRYESEGRKKEAEILGTMQKDLDKIQSQGVRTATVTRGRADAKVLKIYAEAYGKDPEFFTFLRTLKLYSEALGDRTRLVLSTEDNDLLQFLKSYRLIEER